MNKLLFLSRLCMLSVALILGISTDCSAHVNKSLEKWYKAPVVKLTNDVLQNRLDNISAEVDLEITPEVRKRIKEYTVSYTSSSASILGRVMLYFPTFEKEIKKRNLPSELKYVAVVESLLKPEGTSKSGAAGLWQIIKSTGRMLDLEISNTIDERRDPVKSTAAAMEYLEYLYNYFGDWTLAVAAYNCGPGNMRKAIRLGGSKKFSKIKQYLPKETQNYVPRFVAAAYLMNYYHLHNITPDTPREDLRVTSKIHIDKAIDFVDLENELDIKHGTLAKLNPSFVRNKVPNNNKNNVLFIPQSKKESFLAVYQPELYSDMLAERNDELEILEKEEQKIIPSDSLKQLGAIVNVFIDIIYPKDQKEYNIPSSMRSNLSYLRA